MKKLGICLISIFLISVWWYPTLGQAETEIPEIIINELAWAGSSVSSSDEWIELYNTTDQPIDLAGWTLKKVDTSKSTGELKNMLTIPEDHTINPTGYFVIANYNAADSVLAIEPDYQTISVELHNTRLQIQLVNASGVIIDTAWDGTTQPLSSDPKTTLERNSKTIDGTIPTNWHPSTKSSSIYFDINDLGSPFEENSPKPPDPIPAPTISSIDPEPPNQVIAGSDWTITDIVGNNFATEGTVQIKLAKTNPDLSIWATILTVINDTTINSVKFEIPDDTEAGEWDLVVLNPDGQSGILPDAVEILEPEEEPVIPTYSDQIILSELYPHPENGKEEFIELYNQGDNSVNLNGWKLDDQTPGGSAVYAIRTNTILGPHQYLTFPKSLTHISLNDTGDYARLLWPNDTVLAITPNYGVAETGFAYAKFNDNWRWTQQVTSNAKNIYESIDEDEEDEPIIDIDPNSLQANEITIQLSKGKSTDNSPALSWKINLPGALSELKIYQSAKKGFLGIEVGKTTPEKISYPLRTLVNPEKPFFTIIGTYNTQDIPSNQIEITATSSKATPKNLTGTFGTLKQIMITELLPNPETGEEEFIEIFNPNNEEVDISGWQLIDASGRVYVINALDLTELAIAADDEPTAVILAPQQYLLLEYPLTHIRLNNSGGEEVQLLDSKDNLIDEVAYDGSAKPGHVYVLAPNSTWFWSEELTPGEPNDISFASDEDSGNYLVDSGLVHWWPIFLWISALFSAIILAYGKRFYLHYH